MNENITEESIATEELQHHKDLQLKIAMSKLDAEKAVLANKLAETEAQNFILQLYMKYDLKVNRDRILETGKIVRVVEAKPEAPAVEVVENKA